MKEAYMNFRVEPDLRDSFSAAVEEREHRPAAQVLREFMRDYIASGRPAISAEERERRRQAVNFARSNNALEGFAMSAAEEARAERFINGEIDLATYVAGQA